MKHFMTALTLTIAGTALAAGAPQAGNAHPGPRAGGFVPVPADQPLVLAAKAAIQKYFATLQLGNVQEAATQVVAGMNVRILCQVKEGDDQMVWRFQIWRKLDGTWRLTSARRLGPAAPAGQ